jgi:hypothetical protein
MHFSRYTRWNSPIGWSVAAVAAFSALIFPRATTWCWVAFFLIAATLCGSVYRERCGRVHCRITAPLFLLCACYLTLVELDRVPFIGNAWFVAVVAGTIMLAFLAEMIAGRQVQAS